MANVAGDIDRWSAIDEETRDKFCRVPLTDLTDVQAKPGDRMFVSNPAETDVVEVLLVKRDKAICRALTGYYLVPGKKYTLPMLFKAGWPALVPDMAMTQATLMQKPDNAAKADAAVAPVKRGGRKREGETKLDKCRKLWQEHGAKPKAEVVQLFVTEAGCTPAGANTYYLLCKKEAA